MASEAREVESEIASLNEDLKLGSTVGGAGSPFFSGRWASTTAPPKPATKRFIHAYGSREQVEGGRGR